MSDKEMVVTTPVKNKKECTCEKVDGMIVNKNKTCPFHRHEVKDED